MESYFQIDRGTFQHFTLVSIFGYTKQHQQTIPTGLENGKKILD